MHGMRCETVRSGTAILLALLLCANAAGAPAPEAVAAALGHPDRSEADRARDARSRPAEVLTLAGLEAGDVVLDVLGGGGYYSELASRIVGPAGRVYLHNNPPYVAFVGPALDARLGGGRLANVVRLDQRLDALAVPEDSVDLVLMVMSWHDLYWTDERWPDVDVADFVARIDAALAPDGVFVIVDHAALPGTGITAVDALHRIEETAVVERLAEAGFRLTGRSEALRNRSDDRGISVFDPQVRGTTDRFVLRFAPPDAP